ncbi:MAG TPA: prepilin-type N-terminal cleavage/methylation domain-containing protein [Candidatus Saccharimonadales bacterium]|nr:prepilin-type N-terminal cleavage/methylation domain-containing protein [Candidatus Saccharimonadales bacterium]
MKQQKGFTLIELLIVISIIGILAAILTANFIGVRQRGRDAQRKTNIRNIQSALELYRSDQSNYPVSLPACTGSLVDPVNGTTVYMKSIPCDPQGGSYQYVGTSTTYTLVSCLENTGDSDGTTTKPSGFSACSSGSYFVVTNP